MNILLIDDEADITEIIALLLGARFTAEFVNAQNGKDAVKILNSSTTKFDMIFSDFNMPNGNGRYVFEELRKKDGDTPFILLTSDNLDDHPEFKQQANTYYLQKPFDEDSLCSVVDNIFKNQQKTDRTYVPISLNTLLKIHKISVPLYLKINESKHLKIINEGNLFDENEFQKYKQKNLNYLYVPKEDFNNLIIEFKTRALSEMFYKTYKSESTEEFALSASINELIASTVNTFGFSEQTVALAKENIKFVKAIVDRKPDLKELLRWTENHTEYKYELIHSMLICFVTSAITQKFTFKDPRAGELIALAAFFHDTSLDSYQIENETKFREALRQGLSINKVDINLIKQHPQKSSEMLAHWKMCPKEVLSIIENHCERPDGKGFPHGIKANEFDELSACFIFSEDLVNFFLASRNKNRIQEFFIKNAQLYSAAPFKYFLDITKILGL